MDVMDLATLKAHIKTGKLDNWYIFTGPEVKAMDIYLNQMASVNNATVVRLDSVSNLMQKLNSKSFVKNAQILILRDCKEFLSDDKLQAKITQIKTISDYVIVFIYSAIDKRSKLYKSYKDKIVEFEPFKMPVLVKYIQKDIDLSEDFCKQLAEICEMDYSRILLEIDKIKQYKKARPKFSSDAAMSKLLSTGAIYEPPQDAVFDFVDAVLKYKPKLAFRLLQESYASGEVTLVLIVNLYNSTKQLLQFQAYDGNNLAEATGLTPFQIRLASGRKGYYPNSDLVHFMRKLREVEKGIKIGEIEESIAVPYALVSLWR
jgi:DNA polymerase III delta subunit